MGLRDGDNSFGRYLELLPEDLLGGGATSGESEYTRSMAVKAAKSEVLRKGGGGPLGTPGRWGDRQVPHLARQSKHCRAEDATTGTIEIAEAEESQPGKGPSHKTPAREASATEGGWQGQTGDLFAGRAGGRPWTAEHPGYNGKGQTSSSSARRGESDPMEGSYFRPPVEGSVTGLGMQVPYDMNPQAAADSAPGLGALFEVFGVPSDMCLYELADQALLHAKSHNGLQLGIMLIAIGCIVGWPDDTSNLLSLFGTITPFGKGTQSQGTKGRQRDLLPLPLPAFGALLNLVKKLK